MNQANATTGVHSTSYSERLESLQNLSPFNFVQPQPPREKTATELLEEEAAAAAAAADTPTAQNGAQGQQQQFAPPSNNPFGEGASFGQQQAQGQQQGQPGGFGAGAVVPYGQNTFGEPLSAHYLASCKRPAAGKGGQ